MLGSLNKSSLTMDYPLFVCSFDWKGEYILRTIFAISYLIFGIITIFVNGTLLFYFIKFRNSSLSFTIYSFIFLLICNMLIGIGSLYTAINNCIEINIEIPCLLKFCLIYLFCHIMSILNLFIAIDRLLIIRFYTTKKFNLSSKVKILVISNLISTFIIIFFAFSPITFGWNSYLEFNVCTMGLILPLKYRLINCIIFFMALLITMFIYIYIYLFVRSIRRKISQHLITDSNHYKRQKINEKNNRTEEKKRLSFLQMKIPKLWNLIPLKLKRDPLEIKNISIISFDVSKMKKNDKVKILKVQTIMFLIFISCWFPYIICEIYESINSTPNIDKIRSFSMFLILLDTIFNAIIYSSRLEFLKNKLCF